MTCIAPFIEWKEENFMRLRSSKPEGRQNHLCLEELHSVAPPSNFQTSRSAASPQLPQHKIQHHLYLMPSASLTCLVQSIATIHKWSVINASTDLGGYLHH